jgi:hypothetical protein
VKRFLALALLAVLTISCASTGSFLRHPPPSFGFFAKQCVPQRQVTCIVDADLTKEQCDAAVRPAILAVNKAVGRELLVFGGYREFHPCMLELESFAGHVVFAGDKLQGQLAGITRNWHRDGTPEFCIAGSKILLDTGIWTDGSGPSVALHELVHAMGGTHAETGSAFKSVMVGQLNAPGYYPTLTEFDKAALRACYKL